MGRAAFPGSAIFFPEVRRVFFNAMVITLILRSRRRRVAKDARLVLPGPLGRLVVFRIIASHFSPIMIEGALGCRRGPAHDRGVGDPQSLHPVDPQPRIDDGIDLRAPSRHVPTGCRLGG